jgi:hypothetical protein
MPLTNGLLAGDEARATPDLATWAVIAVACGALACALGMLAQQRRFIEAWDC